MTLTTVDEQGKPIMDLPGLRAGQSLYTQSGAEFVVTALDREHSTVTLAPISP